MTRTISILVALWTLAACGKGGDDANKGTGSAGSSAPGPSAPPGSGKTGSAAAPSVAPGSPTHAVTTPNVPPETDERCATPCRFLADIPLADLASVVRTTCSAEWTIPVDDCEQLDYQRNCVYATGGYTFHNKRYQKLFGEAAWYKARPGFKKADLSKAATDNIAALIALRKTCKKGTIEPADRKIVEAFLATIDAGTVQLPDFTGKNIARSEMARFLAAEGKQVYSRRNLDTARYQKPMTDSTEGKLPRAKVITLGFKNPATPGCSDEDDDGCDGAFGPMDLALDANGKVVGMHIERTAP